MATGGETGKPPKATTMATTIGPARWPLGGRVLRSSVMRGLLREDAHARRARTVTGELIVAGGKTEENRKGNYRDEVPSGQGWEKWLINPVDACDQIPYSHACRDDLRERLLHYPFNFVIIILTLSFYYTWSAQINIVYTMMRACIPKTGWNTCNNVKFIL